MNGGMVWHCRLTATMCSCLCLRLNRCWLFRMTIDMSLPYVLSQWHGLSIVFLLRPAKLGHNGGWSWKMATQSWKMATQSAGGKIQLWEGCTESLSQLTLVELSPKCIISGFLEPSFGFRHALALFVLKLFKTVWGLNTCRPSRGSTLARLMLAAPVVQVVIKNVSKYGLRTGRPQYPGHAHFSDATLSYVCLPHAYACWHCKWQRTWSDQCDAVPKNDRRYLMNWLQLSLSAESVQIRIISKVHVQPGF